MNDLLDPVRKKFETPEMKKLINGAYPPPSKIKPGKGGVVGTAGVDESKPSRLDIRIGKIVEVSRHPDAESLYIEKIDLNEEGGNRTIVSGMYATRAASGPLNRQSVGGEIRIISKRLISPFQY